LTKFEPSNLLASLRQVSASGFSISANSFTQQIHFQSSDHAPRMETSRENGVAYQTQDGGVGNKKHQWLCSKNI
jgi:hypothetical protein